LGENNGTRGKDPSPGKKKKPPTRADCKRNMTESSTQTSQALKPLSVARSMSDKEMGEKL
jgi:hypothetical protein